MQISHSKESMMYKMPLYIYAIVLFPLLAISASYDTCPSGEIPYAKSDYQLCCYCKHGGASGFYCYTTYDGTCPHDIEIEGKTYSRPIPQGLGPYSLCCKCTGASQPNCISR